MPASTVTNWLVGDWHSSRAAVSHKVQSLERMQPQRQYVKVLLHMVDALEVFGMQVSWFGLRFELFSFCWGEKGGGKVKNER